MKICKKCQTQNDDDVQFCANCGASLINREEEQNKQSKRMLLAGIIVAIGLLLCVVTWTCSDRGLSHNDVEYNDVEYVDTTAIPEAPVDMSEALPAEGESDVIMDSDVEPEAAFKE